MREVLTAQFSLELHASHNQKDHGRGTGKRIPPPPPGPRTPRGGRTPVGQLPDVKFSDVKIAYRPRHPDGKADPGEIVWAKIPFQEGDGRAKDRPVLVIGRTKDGKNLVGVQLTSKPGRGDRTPIGKGDWDKSGRESYLNTDRFVQIDESNYRREGAYMRKPQFQEIADILTRQQRAPSVELSAQDRENLAALDRYLSRTSNPATELV